jgi:hypothetical protein
MSNLINKSVGNKGLKPARQAAIVYSQYNSQDILRVAIGS